METTVGELRHQSAYSSSRTPVITVTKDAELQKLLGGRRLTVVRFYPDTTDAAGNFTSTFKIEVALEGS